MFINTEVKGIKQSEQFCACVCVRERETNQNVNNKCKNGFKYNIC
jgi:hypothetical protein